MAPFGLSCRAPPQVLGGAPWRTTTDTSRSTERLIELMDTPTNPLTKDHRHRRCEIRRNGVS